MTLIVFMGEHGANLYLVPRSMAEPYNECHGCMLNYNEGERPREVGDRVEHLAYMLGEEPWYDDQGIPPLSDFLIRVSAERETANPEPREPSREGQLVVASAEPPWKQYRIDRPGVDFSRVTRLINCGWLV